MWNCEHCRKTFYNFVKVFAKTKNDFDCPNVNILLRKTKSKRTQDLILQSYELGIARGIKMVDSAHKQYSPSINKTFNDIAIKINQSYSTKPE